MPDLNPRSAHLAFLSSSSPLHTLIPRPPKPLSPARAFRLPAASMHNPPVQPAAKTFPTESAGPHFPSLPLTHTLLRIIPGVPRHAVAPVDWLQPDAVQPHSLSLEARIHDAAAATVTLPLTSASPIPLQWIDFQLGPGAPVHYSGTTTITITVTAVFDIGPVALNTVLLLSDFAAFKGELTRPLLDDHNRAVATLTLAYLVVHPHANPCPFPGEKEAFVPRFSGHRGSGSSGPTKGPHRVLENTIESFLLAALADTPCKTVELDVQITRDHSTVVFHDWYVRPRGHDGHAVYNPDAVRLPVYSLTFAQFEEIYQQSFAHWERDARRGDPGARAAVRGLAAKRGIGNEAFRVRALTLREVCEVLPEDVGLLVEIKYPVPEEDGGEEVAYPERNRYIDLVLDDLYGVARNAGRKVAFLTFDADVATMLALKQQRWPTYLSHCAGLDRPCDGQDPRVVDVDEGRRFVRAVGLDGMMMLNELMELMPGAVTRVVQDGIPILTYGARNSDVEYVQRQWEMGIEGVIADDVIPLLDQIRERK